MISSKQGITEEEEITAKDNKVPIKEETTRTPVKKKTWRDSSSET